MSRKFYEEVLGEAFSGRMMNVAIRNQPLNQFRAPSRFIIFDSLFCLASTEPKFLTFDMWNAGDGLWRLASMPFGRHSMIKIMVPPVDKQDPGQLVMCWNKMVFLVNLLMYAKWLPPILISFLGDASQWVGEQGLHRSVPRKGSEKRGDLELLLLPFRRLRRVEKIIINVPHQCDEHVETLVQDIAEKAYARSPFNLNDKDDRQVMKLEWAWATWLEYLLDDLEGATAARLRWEQHHSLTPEYYCCARARLRHAREHFTAGRLIAIQKALDQRVQCVAGKVFTQDPEGADQAPEMSKHWAGIDVTDSSHGSAPGLAKLSKSAHRNLFGYAIPEYATPRGHADRIKTVVDVPRCSTDVYRWRFKDQYPDLELPNITEVVGKPKKRKTHTASVGSTKQAAARKKTAKVLKLIKRLKRRREKRNKGIEQTAHAGLDDGIWQSRLPALKRADRDQNGRMQMAV